MSMFHDIEWRKQGNRENCIASSFNVADYARKFAQGIGRFSGLDQKRSGTEITCTKPDGAWDDVAEIMMLNCSESGLPVFRGSSAFERAELKSKGKGRSTCRWQRRNH